MDWSFKQCGAGCEPRHHHIETVSVPRTRKYKKLSNPFKVLISTTTTTKQKQQQQQQKKHI